MADGDRVRGLPGSLSESDPAIQATHMHMYACMGAVMAPIVQHEVGAVIKELRHRGIVAVPAVCYIQYKRFGVMAAMATSKYKEDV